MNKKILGIIFLTFLFFLVNHAEEPSITISMESEHFLYGQTTWAKYNISNPTKMPIYIGGIQEKNGGFSLLHWEATAFYPDGKEVPQHRGGEMIIGDRPNPKKKLETNECISWSQPIPVTDVTIDKLPSGEYKLVFCLKYSLKEERGIFEKEVKATTIFYIDTPDGVDAAWLKYVASAKKALFKEQPEKLALDQPLGWGDVIDCGFCPAGRGDMRSQLLQKFPTSTYAAYLVYARLRGFAEADFTNPGFLRSFETGLFLSNSYPTENGWIEMKDEMNAAWWSKWAGIILKNHPNIWFADELRLRLAMNQVALKNYQTAEADFIKLSKEAKPYIAEKAGLFIEIMKQKGWVSAPVENSIPEAKDGK